MQAFESGNLAQARSECDAALQFDPYHAEALHLRAMIAYRLADHQTALAYIHRAIKKEPRNSAFHNSHGIIHQALQQADKAGQAFREAIQLDPANALAQHNLGDLYDGTGQTAAAELCYRAALRCQPDFAEAHNNLGLLLAGRQCYDEAMAMP